MKYFFNKLKLIHSLNFNLNKQITVILKRGLYFSLSLTLISVIILLSYVSFHLSPSLFYIGIFILKSSFIFIVEFIICAFVFTQIKKDLS